MRARAIVDVEDPLGRIDPRIYGHFIEHFGRVIDGGVWVGEDSAVANRGGVRLDVVEALRAIRPGPVRWPGGNFASAYHFADGLGPRAARPVRFDPAWRREESNAFGTEEYIAWCRLAGAEPYICVNAGNGTAEEAAAWVEYCNRDGASAWARRRVANGAAKPHGVRHWAIGNELYGAWQIGHCDAAECARRTVAFAHAMRAVDPAIELVGVGTRHDPDWNWTVVRNAGHAIDHLSMHCYVHLREHALGDILATPDYFEQCLDHVVGTIAGARRAAGIARPIRVALDEWNLWYHAKAGDDDTEHGRAGRLKDGLFTALVFNAFHRRARDLAMANLALLTNALGLIETDGERFHVNAQYLAFLLYAPRTGDQAVRARVDGDGYAAELDMVYGGRFAAAVPWLDVSASWTADGGRLFLHVVNRHPREAVECDLDLRGCAPTRGEATVLTGDDADAANDFARPDRLALRSHALPRAAARFTHAFPPLSATVLELA